MQENENIKIHHDHNFSNNNREYWKMKFRHLMINSKLLPDKEENEGSAIEYLEMTKRRKDGHSLVYSAIFLIQRGRTSEIQ